MSTALVCITWLHLHFPESEFIQVKWRIECCVLAESERFSFLVSFSAALLSKLLLPAIPTEEYRNRHGTSSPNQTSVLTALLAWNKSRTTLWSGLCQSVRYILLWILHKMKWGCISDLLVSEVAHVVAILDVAHLDSDELLMIKSWQKFAGICLS